jgi:septal ring factor EnvC (AmiA/AmiB activator)
MSPDFERLTGDDEERIRIMRGRVAILATILLSVTMASPPAARAQEEPKPEQLKKMYDDTLGQLKDAQNRKNELATENERLNAKLAELKKQLDDANAKVQTLEEQVGGFAEQTFRLRSHYAAWQSFLRSYPDLISRWRLFLGNDSFSIPKDVPSLMDPQWPLSAEG